MPLDLNVYKMRKSEFRKISHIRGITSIHECIREYFNSDHNKITHYLHVISKLFYCVIAVAIIYILDN